VRFQPGGRTARVRASMRDPSPEEFRRFVHRVAELATSFLADLDAKPIQPRTTGAELEAR
jgi:hypothetical protein